MAKGLSGAYRLPDGWLSTIAFKSKQYYLGVFDSAEDAHAAYMKAYADLCGGRVPAKNVRARKRLAGAHPSHGGWSSQTRYKGKTYYLGAFDTEKEAHAAYVLARVELENGRPPARRVQLMTQGAKDHVGPKTFK